MVNLHCGDCFPFIRSNEIENYQYLTWFANRAKVNMTDQEWNQIKENINVYI